VLTALDGAMEKAQVVQRDRQSGQINMFDLLRTRKKVSSPPLPDVADWDNRTTLQFEKEALGFYISGHPLDFYNHQLAALCSADTQRIKDKTEGTEAVLCGMMSIIKEITTKRGDRMGFLSLEDKQGIVEVVAFSNVFQQARPLLEGDEPRVVIGKIQHDEKGTKIIADQIITIEDAQVKAVEALRIHLCADQLDRDGLTRLRHLLMSHPGDCKTFLHLNVKDKAEAVIALSSRLQVNPSATFFAEMNQHFGEHSVEAVHKSCYQ
jgi:DNA polymerase III subunit alpha